MSVIAQRKQIIFDPVIKGYNAWAITQNNEWGKTYKPRETILVNRVFFDNDVRRGIRSALTFDTTLVTSSQINALDPDEARALLLLHETTYQYTNRGHDADPAFADDTLNSQILLRCF